jgi:hypothetical protein
MASLTVRIGAEVSDFQSKIQDVGRSLNTVRSPIQAFSSALSSAGRIARLMGDDGKKLASQIDTLTIATATATVALQSFRAVMASLPVVIGAVRLAMAALLGPVALLIAGLATLGIVAGVLIKRHLDAANAARDHANALDRAAASAQRFTAATRSLTFLQQEHALSYDDIRTASFRAAEGVAKLEAEEVKAAKAARDAARAAAERAAALREQAQELEAELAFEHEMLEVMQVAVPRAQALAKEIRGLRFDARDLAAALDDVNVELDDFNAAANIAMEEARRLRGVIFDARDAGVQFGQSTVASAQAASSVLRKVADDARALTKAFDEMSRRFPGDKFSKLGELLGKNIKGIGDWFDSLRGKTTGASDALKEMFEQRFGKWAGVMQELVAKMHDAFTELFSDILSGARSFSEAITNFFRGVVDSIINILARIAATWVINLLFGLKIPLLGSIIGGAKGGVIPAMAGGGVLPRIQHGGIVSNPTFLVGEGQHAEAVVPLPDNRSIPVMFTGAERGQQEITIPIQLNIVQSPAQIPAVSREYIVATVVDDASRRGPIHRVVKTIARDR